MNKFLNTSAVLVVAIGLMGCNTTPQDPTGFEAIQSAMQTQDVDINQAADVAVIPSINAVDVLRNQQGEISINESSALGEAYETYQALLATPDEVSINGQNTTLTRKIGFSSIGQYKDHLRNRTAYERDYGYKFDRDGTCSNPLNWIKTFQSWSNFFREACRVHDFAHSNFKMHNLRNERERAGADFAFLVNMNATCESLPERSGWTFPRTGCRAAAWAYYSGVVYGGGLPSGNSEAFYGPDWK